jgi:Putative prokaryotic signal transducing protein
MENQGEPNEQLVEIFDTTQESEAMVIGGLLQSAGIESTVIWREAQDVLPGVGGTVVLVREEQAEDARRIIADYRAHPTRDGDESAAPADPPTPNDPSAA